MLPRQVAEESVAAGVQQQEAAAVVPASAEGVQQPEAAAVVPTWAEGVQQPEAGGGAGLARGLRQQEEAVVPAWAGGAAAGGGGGAAVGAPDAREARCLRRRFGFFRRDRLRRPARPARPPAAVRLALAMGRLPLHRRKSRRGKQHETKVGHDDLGPRETLASERGPGWTNESVLRSTNKR